MVDGSGGDGNGRHAERRVVVASLPAWLDLRRLLGEQPFELSDGGDGPGERVTATLQMSTVDAADLAARLRGVGLAGAPLQVRIEPPLPRAAVRAGRSAEAKRLRSGGVGFSRKGVKLDDEGRHSLTPEALAEAMGRRAQAAGVARVIDACCGAGGNAIGFARAGCQVTAIELDADRLAMARHNAGVYGVSKQIRFVHGDARVLLPTLEGDLLFIDPPWGGGYDHARVTLADLPLLGELLPACAGFARAWVKVPPSFDPTGLPGARPRAYFGSGAGDERRVKFLLLELTRPS